MGIASAALGWVDVQQHGHRVGAQLLPSAPTQHSKQPAPPRVLLTGVTVAEPFALASFSPSMSAPVGSVTSMRARCAPPSASATVELQGMRGHGCVGAWCGEGRVDAWREERQAGTLAPCMTKQVTSHADFQPIEHNNPSSQTSI